MRSTKRYRSLNRSLLYHGLLYHGLLYLALKGRPPQSSNVTPSHVEMIGNQKP